LSTQTGNAQVNVDGRTMAVDPAGTTAYLLTASGLNIIPLETPTPPAERPIPNQNGVVNNASYSTQVAQGGLISVFGRNFNRLTGVANSPNTPLPAILGNACVTLNNNPLPLLAVGGGQINAQVPFDLAPGRYPLVVRSIDRRGASFAQTVTVARYAPAVFVDPQTRQAAIYHPDGTPVTPAKPTTRDRRLTIYATGLGAPTGTVRATAGLPAPANAMTQRVQVFFGDPTMSQAEVVVEDSRMVEGRLGLYEIKVYVPGNRLRGSNLPVTIRIGGASSSTTQGLVPTVAVE
jgi:uncharacterized protein (TIGR03437 family)